MRFANLWGLLFLPVPFILAYLAYKGRLFRPPAIGSSVLRFIQPMKKSFADKSLLVLKIAVVFLLSLALLRPQFGKGREFISGKAVDIMIVLDISGSMLAMDFGKHSRIEVAKKEAKRFIKGRPGDRIGLVVFAAKTFLQCPLTIDHNLLMDFIDMVKVGMIQDGTAIGSAIATAINHLKDKHSKSKIIVLITDGVNNAGKIDPITAAKIAKKLRIKVYTIGVGRSGYAPFVVNDPVFGKRIVTGKTELDENLLRQIADLTGAKYFRVEDENGMREVFSEIDKLEKNDIRIERYRIYKDLFPVLLWIALGLIVLTVVLEDLIFRIVP